MGPANSATRAVLMDAAEAVMREKGYAALSARSVAERAELKHQLVFYYFHSMDDLLLATYRRRTARVMQRLEQALDAPRPLHALWDASCEPSDASLSMEYMALANHNEIIREETIAFGERIRRVQADRLAERLRHAVPNSEIFTPVAVTMAITCIAHILGFETVLGISGGHQDTRALVEWCLRQLEPEAAPPKIIPELSRP
jgi:AcrR family transcriptional regulator